MRHDVLSAGLVPARIRQDLRHPYHGKTDGRQAGGRWLAESRGSEAQLDRQRVDAGSYPAGPEASKSQRDQWKHWKAGRRPTAHRVEGLRVAA